jgi:hypothetical protein
MAWHQPVKFTLDKFRLDTLRYEVMTGESMPFFRVAYREVKMLDWRHVEAWHLICSCALRDGRYETCDIEQARNFLRLESERNFERGMVVLEVGDNP